MIRLILAAILALGLTTTAQAFPRDKVQHFTGSIIIGQLLNKSGVSKQDAFLACLAFGVLKEGYDLVSGGGAEVGDIVADGLGCGVGLIDIALDKPINKKYCRIGAYKGRSFADKPECKACKADKTC